MEISSIIGITAIAFYLLTMVIGISISLTEEHRSKYDFFANTIAAMGVAFVVVTVSHIIFPTTKRIQTTCIQEQKVVKLVKQAHKNQPYKYGHTVLLDNGEQFSLRQKYKQDELVCVKKEHTDKIAYIEDFSIKYKTRVTIQ